MHNVREFTDTGRGLAGNDSRRRNALRCEQGGPGNSRADEVTAVVRPAVPDPAREADGVRSAYSPRYPIPHEMPVASEPGSQPGVSPIAIAASGEISTLHASMVAPDSNGRVKP